MPPFSVVARSLPLSSLSSSSNHSYNALDSKRSMLILALSLSSVAADPSAVANQILDGLRPIRSLETRR